MGLDAHALDLYRDLSSTLAGLHRELAMARAAEIALRADVYASSDASSPSGRDLDARHAVARHVVEAVKVEGEIRAVEAQLRYLDHVLEGLHNGCQ